MKCGLGQGPGQRYVFLKVHEVGRLGDLLPCQDARTIQTEAAAGSGKEPLPPPAFYFYFVFILLLFYFILFFWGTQ